MPSKVSASPSSWKAPVRRAVAAVAIRTAMRVGSATSDTKKASAATVPIDCADEMGSIDWRRGGVRGSSRCRRLWGCE